MSDTAKGVDAWERYLCEPVTGRPVICAFEVLAGMTPLVASLKGWGAEPPLLIADGRGTGLIPSPADATIVMTTSRRYGSLTEQVRARMDPQGLLTPDLVAAVETYDPAGVACWWVSPVALNSPLLGRPVLGGRPPQQAALEDKLITDEVLTTAGVPAPTSVIAEATYDDLMRATRDLVDAHGIDQIVWAGDATSGPNGGGDYVRWVRNLDQAEEAAQFFAHECERVRISPFLEGVPCSVHAIVLPDGVMVLRPMELVMLRDPERGRFVYAGMGTTWDPPAADREEMRTLARLVGHALQETYGYRGGFSIDGVLTTDGFQVTELNPRFTGGLSRLAHSAPQLQLELVQVNTLIGRSVRRSAAELEEEAVAHLDEHRFFEVLGISTTTSQAESVEVPVTTSERRFEAADLTRPVVGTVSFGPSPLGSYVRLSTVDGVLGIGSRTAPLGVLLLEFADRTWGTGFGNLLMATDVRT